MSIKQILEEYSTWRKNKPPKYYTRVTPIPNSTSWSFELREDVPDIVLTKSAMASMDIDQSLYLPIEVGRELYKFLDTLFGEIKSGTD